MPKVAGLPLSPFLVLSASATGLRTDLSWPGEDYTDSDSGAWRSPSLVVGWKAACSCEPFKKHVIRAQPWIRVWVPADEDVTGHRIYAGDPSNEDASYVGDREDLGPCSSTNGIVTSPP